VRAGGGEDLALQDAAAGNEDVGGAGDAVGDLRGDGAGEEGSGDVGGGGVGADGQAVDAVGAVALDGQDDGRGEGGADDGDGAAVEKTTGCTAVVTIGLREPVNAGEVTAVTGWTAETLKFSSGIATGEGLMAPGTTLPWKRKVACAPLLGIW